MKWFDRLKTAYKLAASYFAICLMILLSGVFAISQMAEINNNSHYFVENTMPSVSALVSLKDGLARYRLQLLQHVFSDSSVEYDKYETRMAEMKGQFEKDHKKYSVLIDNPKEKALYASFIASRDAYLRENDQFIALSRAGKKDEAKTLLRGESARLNFETSGQIDDLLKQNMTASEETIARGNVIYKQAIKVILAVILASIVFAVVVAIAIIRDLMARLGGEPDYAARIAGEIALGRLDVTISLAPGDTNSLLFAMKTMRDDLSRIVGQVRSGSNMIAVASGQIAAGNLDLSSRTEEQASALEQTASSMEELTGAVSQNGDNAMQANNLALFASDLALKGGVVVAQVVDTMGAINISAKKIVDIISVIDGIAFQTNILALNAAVEAARAGTEGRGFAVVASEVRNLAQRSAAAAKEIKTLIDDSVERVEVGVKLADRAGASMAEIVGGVKRVTDVLGEIAEAGQEQRAGIDQINQAIAQMDQVTQQNASLVEQAAAAAESMQEQAENLAELVSVFSLDSSHNSPALALAPSTKDRGTVQTKLQLVVQNAARNRLTEKKRANPTSKETPMNWEEF